MHFKKQRTDIGVWGWGIEEPPILPLQLSCKSKSVLKLKRLIFFLIPPFEEPRASTCLYDFSFILQVE